MANKDTDIFAHADKSLMVILNDMSREFQKIGTQVGFDELDVMEIRKTVNAMYKRMDAVVQREYQKICLLAYQDAMEEAGSIATDDFDAEAFVASALSAYDPLSDFVYTREWERKRDRTFEGIIATQIGNQEMRKLLKRGLDVLANQVRQYADNITIQARLEAFKRAGYDMLAWVTEKDERVCEVCGPRDEQIYPLEDFLTMMPAHYHCRCHPEIVDMESIKKRKRRDN